MFSLRAPTPAIELGSSAGLPQQRFQDPKVHDFAQYLGNLLVSANVVTVCCFLFSFFWGA